MSRRSVVLFSLLLTFVIVLILDYLTADWHYVRYGEAGQVLYAATFDEFLSDWDREDDEPRLAQVDDGALWLRVAVVNDSIFSVTGQRFGDFDLSVRMTAAEGPLDNAFGVVFRLRDTASEGFLSYLLGRDGPVGRLADIFLVVPEKSDLSYYLFLVSSDGYYRVSRVLDDREREISAWIPSPLVNQGIGAVNVLRVVASGDHFQFYVNGDRVQLCIPNDPDARSTYFDGECLEGAMLDTLQDDAIRRGHVGVTIRTFGEPGVGVRFDDVLLLGPEALE